MGRFFPLLPLYCFYISSVYLSLQSRPTLVPVNVDTGWLYDGTRGEPPGRKAKNGKTKEGKEVRGQEDGEENGV